MEKLFINIFQMSIYASYLILAVLLVRFLLRKAPKSMRSFLWLLVGIRLLVPFSVESVFSLIPNTQIADAVIDTTVPPEPDTLSNIPSTKPSVSQSVNTILPANSKHTDKAQTAVLLCAKIWLAGMALMLGYMVISWLHLKGRVKMSVPTDAALDGGGTKISQKIYQSDAIESPFLFGIIKPRIYIPNRVDSDALFYVVLHEMTHLKRKDHLVKPAGFVLLSVYWFNPLVWAAYIMLCRDIELICDEKVVRQLGASCKKTYSQALLNSTVKRRVIAACPVAFGEVSVKERVKNVLDYKKPAFWVLAAAVLACIIVPVCFMTQKKASSSANPDIQSKEVYFLDDFNAMSGDYEMLNPEQYPLVPSLRLGDDGTFTFSYSVISSYLPYGTYERKDNILTASTDDGKYHYQFTCVGDVNDSLLFFDAAHSSDVTDIDTKLNADAPIRDGSIFVKNILSQTLSDAQELSQTFNQNIAQGTTMTASELQDQLLSLTELQRQLTVKETQVQRQLERSKELQLTPEESAVLETTLQGWIQASRSATQQLEEDLAACQSMIDASEVIQTAPSAASEYTLSVSPRVITSQNVDDTIAKDAKLLEALFPDHHESIPNISFPCNVDLNGDGVDEQLEFTDLGYNGGDGGYALTVTDSETGNKIPLPDGYTEESGFPIHTFYSVQQGAEAQLLVRLGEQESGKTVAVILQEPLYRIYERRNLSDGLKNVLPDRTCEIGAADALSGCSVFRYEDEENPVILLKTYVSGFLGHIDTLGYVITELRLQEDNTWISKHYFLFDGCLDPAAAPQETGIPSGNGNSFLPFDEQTDVDFIQLSPED